MLNVIASIIVNTIALILKAAYAIKGPLAIGAVVAGIILAFPAESYAATIQCNATHCDPIVSTWSSLIIERKAAVICIVVGLVIAMYLSATEKK